MTSDFNIDLSRLDAPCLEATLEPGDILFLPAFWWHNVVSLDASISVNYWWRPPLSACLYPNFFRMVSSRTIYYDPSVIALWVDIRPHMVSTSLCLFLADKGHVFAAAALAGAIVTSFCVKVFRMLASHESAPLVAEAETGGLPDFPLVAKVIPGLNAHGLISSSQSGLLLKWLDLAAETAAAPEPFLYNAEYSAAIRDLIWKLHDELGDCLSI